MCRVRRTYSLPPAFSFVYSSPILNCPMIYVCSINSMAVVASQLLFKMARSLCRPGKPSNSRSRRSLYFLHLRRMWATVCRLSPHSHLELVTPGTCRWKRKSFSPIFSVLSCTSSALFLLLRPWRSWSTLVGTDVSYKLLVLWFLLAIWLSMHP